LIATEKLEWP